MWKVRLDLLNCNKTNRTESAVYLLVELRIICADKKKSNEKKEVIFMQNRKIKKLPIFVAVTILSVVTVGTTAFASSQLYDSEEGIGIEVHCTNPNAREDIEDNYTSVLGGTLWTTWRSGQTYRANYDHSSKEHRCTAQNGDGVTSRSAWTEKGNTARSGFIYQTPVNNKSYAKTR